MNDALDFGCHHLKRLLASSLDAPMSSLSFSASVRESDGMSVLQALTCVVLLATALFSTHVVI